jgi:DNA-binding beta-propeller fold protein YncE
MVGEAGDLLASVGWLYASFPADGSVVIIDGSTGRESARVRGLARPFGLALDERAGILYVAEAGADSVAAIDVGSGAVLDRLPTGRSPYVLALDAAGQRLYVATPGDKSVWVLSLAGDGKRQRAGVGGLGLALGLATDENGQAFFVYAVSPKTRAIARIDATAGEIVLKDVVQGDYSLPLTDAAGLVVDAGRLYVTDGGYLRAFDAGSGQRLGTWRVEATADTFGLERDVQTERLIIADARGGKVQLVETP